MDLMERFLDGEVSVICHSREEIEKLSMLFEQGSRDRRIIVAASKNGNCLGGAEFAYEDKFIPGDRYIHYNPISRPLSQYSFYSYTETLDFSEFCGGLDSIAGSNKFDVQSFYTMLGMSAQEV